MPQPAALWPSRRNVLRQRLAISEASIGANCYTHLHVSCTYPVGMKSWVGLSTKIIKDLFQVITQLTGVLM